MSEWQKFLMVALVIWGSLIAGTLISSKVQCEWKEEARSEKTPFHYEYGIVTGCHAVWHRTEMI